MPEAIDAVDQTQFSKEWLEQVINNTRPRIDGIIIHPVPLNTGTNQVAYTVEIPQSTTAHQATDFRYYKRFNFQSVPMEDYEVRDVMGRSQHPRIDLEFEIELTTQDYIAGTGKKPITKTEFHLKVIARNLGPVYAQFVNSFIRVPAQLLHESELEYRKVFEESGQQYCECYGDNTVRNVVDVGGTPPYTYKKYGPSRFEPILPGLLHKLITVQLVDNFSQSELTGLKFKWVVHVDNAQPNSNETLITDVEIVDKRG